MSDATDRDDSRPPDDLSIKQEQLISALLISPTQDSAAESVGIHRATMYRWFREDAFRAQFREAQTSLYRHSLARIQSATSEAVDTLREIMRDSDCPAPARVSAAKSILEAAKGAYSQAEIETHAAELERKLNTLIEYYERHQEQRGKR